MPSARDCSLSPDQPSQCLPAPDQSREIRRHRTLHAEARVILLAAQHGWSLKGSILYVTHPPCAQCAGLLIESGVREVWIVGSDRLNDEDWGVSLSVARDLFQEAGIPCNPLLDES